MSRKVAVVGSRQYPDLSQVRMFVTGLPEGTVVVSGGAFGVDAVAAETAREMGLGVVEFPAEWEKFGRSAGIRRNLQIVELADEVVAFWDGKSPGTAHSIRAARLAGKPTRVFNAALSLPGEPTP